VVMGRGRSVLRVGDLLELLELAPRLGARLSPAEGEGRKGNYAASVKPITPRRW
jgi:hypothetical protein